jgi:hypothetical protein
MCIAIAYCLNCDEKENKDLNLNLVRLLSELNSLGWKLTSSADISAKYLTTKKGKRCNLIFKMLSVKAIINYICLY